MKSEVIMRYSKDSVIYFGFLDGRNLLRLEGDLFDGYTQTDIVDILSEVKPLFPYEPRQIFAVGRNYKSHLKDRDQPTRPEIFFKPYSSLLNPGDPIILPKDANNVHLEGELVLVIGQKTSRVSIKKGREAVFGVSCGNDVSERDWQRGPDKDLQWWRAKGSNTFAPFGPVIARGLHCDDLLLTTRLNGTVVQEQRTSDLIFDASTIISYISQYVTLWPGDIIFTGTPGNTEPLAQGDIVNIEIEDVGILSNPVSRQ